jgi:hypothetical protein
VGRFLGKRDGRSEQPGRRGECKSAHAPEGAGRRRIGSRRPTAQPPKA